jgi:N6-L-threonylcarbamoyladenine synthase
MKDYTNCTVVGSTRDDAVGEAYDKVARVLGLGYPGGPKVDKLAKEGNLNAIHFKRVLLDKNSYEFSFSGLKTAVLNYINSTKQSGGEINKADVAAGFQQAVMDVIVEKTMLAAKKMGYGKLVVAGGVASNSKLRQMLKRECDKENIKLYVPSPILCTDNAAMIGCGAYYKYMAGLSDGLDMDAHANFPL